MTSSPRASSASDDGRPEHARGAGDQDLHGRRPARSPARTRSAHAATRARSIFDWCRMSTGSFGTTSTAVTSTPRGPPDRSGQPRPGEQRAGAERGLSGTTTTTTWAVPRRPDPDDRGVADFVQRRHPLLDAHRRDARRAPSRSRAPAAPRPRADRSTSRWPTSLVRCQPGFRALLRSVAHSRSYRSLTWSARTQISPVTPGSVGQRPVGERRPAASGLIATSTPATGRPTHTPLPVPAASISVQRDRGHRQRLGHAVRRVQLGAGQHLLEPAQQRDRDRRTGGQQRAAPTPARRGGAARARQPSRRRCAARRARRTPAWRRSRPPRPPARSR